MADGVDLEHNDRWACVKIWVDKLVASSRT